MKIPQINDEISKILNEIRALEDVLFNVDIKFAENLKKQKQKMWNKINFLKGLKKACLNIK